MRQKDMSNMERQTGSLYNKRPIKWVKEKDGRKKKKWKQKKRNRLKEKNGWLKMANTKKTGCLSKDAKIWRGARIKQKIYKPIYIILFLRKANSARITAIWNVS